MQSTRLKIWVTLLLSAACLAAYGAPLLEYARNLWTRPHYQFFPLLLIIAAALCAQRLQGAPRVRPVRSTAYALLCVPAALLLLLGSLIHSPWLCAVSAWLLLVTTTYAIGRKALLVRLLPVWALLLLVVRPPLELDQQVVTRLQFLTSRLGGQVLDALGVIHAVKGNLIEIPMHTFFVEEACSGINSLLTLLAVVSSFAIWRRLSPVLTLVSILAAVFWALFFNVARLVGVVGAWYRWDIHIDSGWRHEVFGAVLFVLAVACIYSSVQLVAAFLPRQWTRSGPAFEGEWPSAAPVLDRAAALVPLGLLFLAAIAVQLAPRVAGAERAGHDAASAPQFEPDTLPESWQTWTRERYETEERASSSFFGQHSQYWLYDSPSHKVTVSLDYPFTTWHALEICYRSQGWRVEHQRSEPFVTADGSKAGDVATLKLSRDGQSIHGYVCWISCNATLEPMKLPDFRFRAMTGQLRTATEAVIDTDWTRLTPPKAEVFQIQVLVWGFTPVPRHHVDQAHQFLRLTHQRLQTRWPAAGGQD